MSAASAPKIDFVYKGLCVYQAVRPRCAAGRGRGTRDRQASVKAGINPPGGVILASALGSDRDRRRGGRPSVATKLNTLVHVRGDGRDGGGTLSSPSKFPCPWDEKNLFRKTSSLFSLLLSLTSVTRKVPGERPRELRPWRLLPASDGPRVAMLSSREEVAEARHRTFGGGRKCRRFLGSIHTPSGFQSSKIPVGKRLFKR